MDQTKSYKIRGTKVTSPYPVQLTPGEHRLVFSLQKFFSPSQILPDCYFPNPDGPTKASSESNNNSKLAQIDCLAINETGIFVFESKDYSGWIYGHGDRHQWTQVLNFGKEKHQFYNPIKQNARHIAALETCCDSNWQIYSVIVFSREATLKVIDEVPENCIICTQSNLLATLSQLCQAKSLNSDQVAEVLDCLSRSRVIPDTIIRDLHIDEAEQATSMRQPR